MSPSLLVVLSSLATAALAAAHVDSLFTSSLSYCAPPSAVLVEQFDIRYFEHNQSVVFDITAASVEPLNVSAQIALNVYGIKPVNLTLDLCQLSSALCPLPQYNFSGSGTVPLPPSFTSKLPQIAYKIPDLEAFAQLTLTRLGTDGELAACIQSTLENGWSMHQPAVEWTTGAIALLAFLSSLCLSLPPIFAPSSPSPPSPDPLKTNRVADVLLLFQHIALTGALHINPPSAYNSFTTNFAWAFGFLTASSSHIQHAIDNMRHHTGSLGQDGPLDVDGYVNRKNSPYNAAVLNLAVIDPREGAAVPTVSPQNTLSAGIPLYANSVGVSTANAFMSLFFTVLFLVLIAAALFACISLIASLLHKKRGHAEGGAWRGRYTTFVRIMSIRLAIIIFLPTSTLVFYQWTTKDSWLAAFLSAVVILALYGSLGYALFYCIRHHSHASLAKESGYFPRGTVVLLPVLLLKAIFGGFAQASGLTQVIALAVIELAFLALLFSPRLLTLRAPSGRIDRIGVYLGLTRTITSFLLIAFATEVQAKPIPRVAIGLVMALIFSIAVLVLFVRIVLDIWQGARALRSKQEGAHGHSGAPGVPLGNSVYEEDEEKRLRDTSQHEASPTPQRPESIDSHGDGGSTIVASSESAELGLRAPLNAELPPPSTLR